MDAAAEHRAELNERTKAAKEDSHSPNFDLNKVLILVQYQA